MDFGIFIILLFSLFFSFWRQEIARTCIEYQIIYSYFIYVFILVIMMSIREHFEERERSFISPYGCLSSESRGRRHEEDACPIRTAFQLDRDRIIYSNGFRRLKHKTQVFLSPMGDHYRTRLTHTLEVAEIARTISRALRLNEDLTEAIALGHDLGHTPFGHSGEMALKEIYSSTFSHNKQSLRLVDVLDRHGKGLNLTYEVRDGILKHSKGGFGNIIPDSPEETAFTVEGRVVRIADIMAYLNHDLDDAIRGGVIRRDQIPKECVRILGKKHSERANTMIKDLIFSSRSDGDMLELRISDDVFGAMTTLRHFLYENVYRSYSVHKEFVKAKKIICELYHHFLNDEEKLCKELTQLEIGRWENKGESVERAVCDVIASMTDRYALRLYSKLFFPNSIL
jgi:dGTPase